MIKRTTPLIALLSVHECATRLSVSLRTVYTLIDCGKLKAHKIGGDAQGAGGAIRVSPRDLQEYFASTYTGRAADASRVS